MNYLIRLFLVIKRNSLAFFIFLGDFFVLLSFLFIQRISWDYGAVSILLVLFFFLLVFQLLSIRLHRWYYISPMILICILIWPLWILAAVGYMGEPGIHLKEGGNSVFTTGIIIIICSKLLSLLPELRIKITK